MVLAPTYNMNKLLEAMQMSRIEAKAAKFFDLHELQNRVDDFQRIIGEARWGFYHR